MTTSNRNNETSLFSYESEDKSTAFGVFDGKKVRTSKDVETLNKKINEALHDVKQYEAQNTGGRHFWNKNKKSIIDQIPRKKRSLSLKSILKINKVPNKRLAALLKKAKREEEEEERLKRRANLIANASTGDNKNGTTDDTDGESGSDDPDVIVVGDGGGGPDVTNDPGQAAAMSAMSGGMSMG
ncbi:MAG: hypothetical protein ACTSXQ_00250 [Alphaproteobacteria bacterium]